MLDETGSRGEQARLGLHHEEYLELCALATSGSLNEAERTKLREHLAACCECREAVKEFGAVVDELIPELTPQLNGDTALDPSFSQEKAEASFQKRLAAEREREQIGVEAGSLAAPLVTHRTSFRSHFERYEIWLPLLASAVLCVTLGILGYRTGRNHGIEWARLEQRSKPVAEAVLAPPEPDPGLQDAQLAARDTALAVLRREVIQKSSELEKLRALASSQQLALRASSDDKNGVTEQRDRLLQQVSADEESLRTTEARLKNLERERSEYVMRTASLETAVADLSRSLEERERLTTEQKDLLAKDRDIRELIGARDLYITEIYDVARNGDTRKAAGRVFYTKGKSLVFYAYDLNENPGLKNASSFEAWGQRGPDWHQASKLGIFYEDNTSKKRWVVKSNDRKTLDQIDAVFVTVEPNGGSERPTGKPLLFAYLKVAPNHP
jgi:predicted  nucleic acid-binding Zn-ribbon protein